MAAQSTLRQTPADRFSDAFDQFYARLVAHLDRLPRKGPFSSRTTRLIATLALSLAIVTGGYGGYKTYKRRKAERETGRRLVRRNSGLRGKDGSRTIFVPYKDSTSRVTIFPTKKTTFDAHRRLFLSSSGQAGTKYDPATGPPPTNIKPGLNIAFLHQFLSLMSVMVPRWRSKESGLLATHAIFLLARTYLSLVVARLDGEIVRDLVAGQGKAFLLGICKWLAIGSISSYTNSMIKFLQSKISIAFRTRLTRYIHDLYLSPDLAYYKLHNLDGGIGQGADQFITQDLTLFCDSAASLYSSLGKPLVDIFTFNFQLYHSLGPVALTGLLATYFGTATLLRKLSPPFGKLKAMEGRKEGEFRSLHARLIANAEEVAFYNGGATEHVLLDKSFKELKTWVENIYKIRVGYNILEDFMLKYSWSAFGYIITSLPVFLPVIGEVTPTPRSKSAPGSVSDSVSDVESRGQSDGRMKQFITNKRLMLNLADAGSRMMYSIKDLSELAGYTSRVYTLISTLHRVHAKAYAAPRYQHAELYSLASIEGTLHRGFDGVRLEDVPVVAPGLYPMGGEELIENLSFIVGPGDHLLITGPNGAGKSAVARIVAGLWPTYRGLTSRPRQNGQDGIMFLPQRPYLSPGTLRDQVIYPHTEMDMRDSGRREHELQNILEEAKLGYLTDREGGWDTRKEWKDVLSGGEKQRMGIARLLYHEPRFAFIDEGTSAVSSDVEGLLYEQAKSKGISKCHSVSTAALGAQLTAPSALITISTRASLKRYHSYTLTLGLGEDANEYEFLRVGTASEKDSVEKELQELRERLAQVDAWKLRRKEIEEELGEVWVSNAGESGAGMLEASDGVYGEASG